MENLIPQTSKEITSEIKAEWLKKHNGKVFEISVELEEEDQTDECKEALFFVKRLSVAQTKALAELAADKKTRAKAGDMMIKSMILGGDMKYISDTMDDSYVLMGVLEKIDQLTSEKKTSLKKLSIAKPE
jgi:hypothetical protein